MGRRKKFSNEESATLKAKIVSEFQKENRPTIVQTAEKYKVSKQYISQVLREADESLGRPEFFDVSKTVALIFELSKLSIAELAEILGVTRVTVYGWRDGRIQAGLRHSRQLELLLTALQNARSSKK
jgi:DNA-binding transcriptional regulator YiaG